MLAPQKGASYHIELRPKHYERFFQIAIANRQNADREYSDLRISSPVLSFINKVDHNQNPPGSVG